MMTDDYSQERRLVLYGLKATLRAAGLVVDFKVTADGDFIEVYFEGHVNPVVVNIALDNNVAMLVDIFKQAGPDMIARA
jgi:hypothetical protein